jgi:GGDEF domain-containing protein
MNARIKARNKYGDRLQQENKKRGIRMVIAEKQARIDSLTGTFNRPGLQARLNMIDHPEKFIDH